MLETFLISKGRPESGTISPYAGQWHGLLVQVHRWLAGFMFELMIWIRESPKTVLSGKELAALVGKLPLKLQKIWREVVKESIVDEKQKKRPHDLWQDIRNSAAFHYEPTRLVRGYFDHFRDGRGEGKGEATTAAMFSRGITMQASRFYYADAAQQALLHRRGVHWKQEKVSEKIADKARDINDVLAPLIYRFIDSRTAESATGKR